MYVKYFKKLFEVLFLFNLLNTFFFLIIILKLYLFIFNIYIYFLILIFKFTKYMKVVYF